MAGSGFHHARRPGYSTGQEVALANGLWDPCKCRKPRSERGLVSASGLSARARASSAASNNENTLSAHDGKVATPIETVTLGISPLSWLFWATVSQIF